MVESVMLDEAIRLSLDSIDDQVNSILLRFESDCIVDVVPSDELGEAYRPRRLNELQGDDDDKDDEDAPANASVPQPSGGAGDPADDDKSDIADRVSDHKDKPPNVESDPLKPKIDLKKFAGKVSRLASNYDALLDMPIAIANLAKNYLEQNNYGHEVVEEFVEILERDFGIELERDELGEPRQAPIAVGAAASGLGGG